MTLHGPWTGMASDHPTRLVDRNEHKASPRRSPWKRDPVTFLGDVASSRRDTSDGLLRAHGEDSRRSRPNPTGARATHFLPSSGGPLESDRRTGSQPTTFLGPLPSSASVAPGDSDLVSRFPSVPPSGRKPRTQPPAWGVPWGAAATGLAAGAVAGTMTVRQTATWCATGWTCVVITVTGTW